MPLNNSNQLQYFVCEVCGVDFTRRYIDPKKKVRVCSRDCMRLLPKKKRSYEKIDKICESCEQPFQVPVCRSTKRFCCWECRNAYISELRCPENRGEAPSYRCRYDRLNADKVQARNSVHYHVSVGKLIKPNTCESCGEAHPLDKIDAHHYLGYEHEHWLDVEWLCKKCHQFQHRSEKRKRKSRK